MAGRTWNKKTQYLQYYLVLIFKKQIKNRPHRLRRLLYLKNCYQYQKIYFAPRVMVGRRCRRREVGKPLDLTFNWSGTNNQETILSGDWQRWTIGYSIRVARFFFVLWPNKVKTQESIKIKPTILQKKKKQKYNW